MRRWRGIGILAIVACGLAGTLVYAQSPGGMGQSGPPSDADRQRMMEQMRARPPMSEADQARMRQQMQDRMLEQAGLNNKEKAAARKALAAKEKARQRLLSGFVNLRLAANNAAPANAAALRKALAEYRSALAQYRQTVNLQDAALSRQLSPLSEARCLAAGILDNGLGGMGAGRMGRMMRPMGPGAGPSMGPGMGPEMRPGPEGPRPSP